MATLSLPSRDEPLTPDTPHAPAAAPNHSLSNAVEAQPQPLKNKRARRRASKLSTLPIPTLEHMFGTQSETWTRFHSITGTGNLDNLEIYEELNNKLEDDFECFRRKDGTIIVDAKTKRNSEEVEKIQRILDNDITTSRDARLNSVRGTILVPLGEFRNSENLESRIFNHLLHQNIPVSKVDVYNKTSRKNIELTCANITFESRKLPETVRIGFEKVKVKENLPKPRQCRSCWKFGHPAEYCKSVSCCPICGVARHSLDDCPHKGNHTYKGHCPNCGEDDHTALSKQCTLYRREEEILMLMYRQGIPKNKARELIVGAGMFAGITYAKRVAQAPNSQRHHQQTAPQCQPQPGQKQQQHQQAPPAQLQQQHQQTPPAQLHQTQPAQQHQPQPTHQKESQSESPESLMSIMFSEVQDPFLSIEAESLEQCSSDEPPPQVPHRKIPEGLNKRK